MIRSMIPFFLMAAVLLPQTSMDEVREKRLQWWRDARFGLFIHWGVYAVPAGEWEGKPSEGLGEWIMFRSRIPVAQYEKLATQFNPEKFNADEIVRIAKDAGMKYIVITAKHHDGFAMFGSKASKYNIVDATPFHRDPIKELSVACQRGGLKLCFYYSQTQDWHEADADGNTWDWPDESKKDFKAYFRAKVIPQVRELLTNYGPVGLIWFDTPKKMTREESVELANLVHELQPSCLVNGRVGNNAGDYDSVGDNQISVGTVKREWETPVTLNDTWGFRKDDSRWKPASILIQQLALTASRGGNYLLNIGPTALGEVPQPSVERLAAVGRWMKVNEESIRGTVGSPFPYDHGWGVITTKPGKLYLHVLNWPKGNELVLYGLDNKVKSARLLAGNVALKTSHSTEKPIGVEMLRIALPAAPPDPNDSVISLEIEGPVKIETSLIQQHDGSITLPAYLANIHKGVQDSKMRLDSRGVVVDWLHAGESVDWNFKLRHRGTFDVIVTTSEQKYGRGWDGGQEVVVDVAGQTVKNTIREDSKDANPANPYWGYVGSKIGRVTLDKHGTQTLSLKAATIASGQKFGLTLVSVKLVPVQ